MVVVRVQCLNHFKEVKFDCNGWKRLDLLSYRERRRLQATLELTTLSDAFRWQLFDRY